MLQLCGGFRIAKGFQKAPPTVGGSCYVCFYDGFMAGVLDSEVEEAGSRKPWLVPGHEVPAGRHRRCRPGFGHSAKPSPETVFFYGGRRCKNPTNHACGPPQNGAFWLVLCDKKHSKNILLEGLAVAC